MRGVNLYDCVTVCLAQVLVYLWFSFMWHRQTQVQSPVCTSCGWSNVHSLALLPLSLSLSLLSARLRHQWLNDNQSQCWRDGHHHYKNTGNQPAIYPLSPILCWAAMSVWISLSPFSLLPLTYTQSKHEKRERLRWLNEAKAFWLLGCWWVSCFLWKTESSSSKLRLSSSSQLGNHCIHYKMGPKWQTTCQLYFKSPLEFLLTRGESLEWLSDNYRKSFKLEV